MNNNRRSVLTGLMAITVVGATTPLMATTKNRAGKMTLNDALQLVASWGESAGDSTYKGRMLTAADGGFLTMSRGAVFRY